MTVIPILEIVLLLNIHGHLASFLGSGNALLITIGTIILTGVIGANLAKSQGFAILTRIQKCTATGQMPTDELIEGIMVLVGGVLLLTPGYATDLLGFTLMLPPSRILLKNTVKAAFQSAISNGSVHVRYYGQGGNQQAHHGHVYETHYQESVRQRTDSNVIDVEPIIDNSSDKK